MSPGMLSMSPASSPSGGSRSGVGAEGSVRPVLVVDDEADARTVLAMLLEMEGYPVRTARDGLEALEILRREPVPCLVLLDLMMPRVDGWEVLRRMKGVGDLAEVPVVVLSGVADLEGSTAELGVAAALTRPVDVDRLLEMVGELYHCG